MKKFEMPTMDVEDLKIMDVITTSEECYDCPDYEPCDWDAGGWSLRNIFG